MLDHCSHCDNMFNKLCCLMKHCKYTLTCLSRRYPRPHPPHPSHLPYPSNPPPHLIYCYINPPRGRNPLLMRGEQKMLVSYDIEFYIYLHFCCGQQMDRFLFSCCYHIQGEPQQHSYSSFHLYFLCSIVINIVTCMKLFMSGKIS